MVVTVRISPEIHKTVKLAAVESGLTVGELYESGALRVLRDMGKITARSK